MRPKTSTAIILISISILFQSQTSLASSLLNARLIFWAGIGPCSMATGDLDGDGNLDLAVANSTSSDVSVLLG